MRDDDDRIERPNDDPPRRAVVIGLVFVIVLAVGGFYVVHSMTDMGRLQDCAATGRRDC